MGKKYGRVETTGGEGNKMPCDPGKEHHIKPKRHVEQEESTQSFALNETTVVNKVN